MLEPKVTVCVVTFNHSRFIDACVESVLAQVTSFPFELVVGEDCSTDDTRSKLLRLQERCPARIRLVLHPANIGALENFRAVLAASRGRYIAHLDGDDAMLPGKLQKQADILDAEPGISVVAHDMEVIDDVSGKAVGRYGAGLNPPPRGTLNDLVRHGTYFCHSSKMFRRECLEHLPLDSRTRHVADWLLHIQNACLGDVGYLDEVLGVYRRHHGGISANVSRDYLHGIFSDQMYTVDRARALGADAQSIAAGVNRLCYSMSLRCLQLGLYQDFRDFIGRSSGYYNIKHWLYFHLRGLPPLVRGIERLVALVKR
jgi:glycosyltransferase involved in cell wall biosynthesis